MKEAEKRFIFKTLHETKGNRTHAAKTLGISIRTLRNKLNEYRAEVGELELEAEDRSTSSPGKIASNRNRHQAHQKFLLRGYW